MAMHLSDAVLWRARHQPEGVAPAVRRHLSACAACRERAAALDSPPPSDGSEVLRPHRLPRAVYAVAGATLLGGGLWAATPLWAAGSTTVLVPRGLAPVTVSGRLTPVRPSALGTLVLGAVTSRSATSWSQAERWANLAGGIRQPGWLPAGLGTPHLAVVSAAPTSLTFSAAAVAQAQKQGVPVPTLPSALNGAVVTAHLRPALLVRYGPSGSPQLTILEAPAPSFTTNGVPISAVAAYLARFPGLPPALAQAVSAMAGTQRVPLPVPAGRATAQTMSLGQGITATVVSTKTGGLVAFYRNGMWYLVGGRLGSAALLRVAQGLV